MKIKIYKNLKIILISLIITSTTYAQNQHIIDSIKHEIATAKHDTTKINAYLAWGEKIYLQKPDSSIILWQQALNIANKNLKNLKNEELKITILKLKASILNNIGYIYNNQGNITKALEYHSKSLNIKKEIGDKKGMANSFINIGYIYNNQGDIPKTLEYYGKSLKIREEIGDKKGMANSFNNIGYIYQIQKDIPKALEYFNKSLNIREEIVDKKGTANSFNNIGYIYQIQKDIPKALEYFKKSLNIREEIGDKKGIAYSFNNIGYIYQKQENIPKALEYFGKSLNIREEIKDKRGMVYSLISLGRLNQEQKNFSQSRIYTTKGYEISKELGFPKNIEDAACLMKDLSISQGNYKKAFKYYQEEIQMRDSVRNEENYKQTQKQQAHYEYQKQAAVDSIDYAKSIEIKDLDLARQKAEGEKQKAIIWFVIAGLILLMFFSVFLLRLFIQKKKANKVLAYQKLEIEEKNEELNQQNEEISAQRDEIEVQRDRVTEQKNYIEEQKEEIEDSIHYAKRIQNAVLPNLNQLFKSSKTFQKLEDKKLEGLKIDDTRHSQASEENKNLTGLEIENIIASETKQSANNKGITSSAMLPRNDGFDHFIIFKPHSVVSGDFYWATRTEKWLIVTAADCTGHGVPGAFMSMLGVSFLNEIVRKKEITNAAEILNQLRASIIDALKQTGEEGTQQDGMDMSIIAINLTACHSELPYKNSHTTLQGISPVGRNDKDSNHVYQAQWAGANNPLYIVKSEKLKVKNGEKTRLDELSTNVIVSTDTEQNRSENKQSINNEEITSLATLPRNDKNLIEVKGDKMPVSVYLKMNNFTNHEIKLNKGDKFYMFSDGFPDQFGGPKGKKFKSKQFKQLIIDTSSLSMQEQGKQMEKTFDKWTNWENQKHEQIDDVTVLGIKI